MVVLDAKGIKKVYKGSGKSASTNALNGLNLTIERGEFVAIMGPSGSGKTTLLNVLSGIDKPTAGNILISGQNINKMKKNELALFRRRHLGFVFQEFNLLDSLTVKENVMLPMILDKRKSDDIVNNTYKVMSMFNIEDIAEKYPYTVSGGQQQRAAICRAIINDPDMIFADEPTGNLDSKSSSTVMNCFDKLNVISGRTILIVTHDAYAASYCNRVVFIRDGLVNSELKKTGTRASFFESILESLAKFGGDQKYELQSDGNKDFLC